VQEFLAFRVFPTLKE
jgi:hypothetical protein